jgi:hypothetical protein
MQQKESMDNKVAGSLILSAALILQVGAHAQSGISAQIVNPSAVVPLGTSLNHVSVIELPEPVENAVIGSEMVRMEYRGNTVLVEPLKAGVSTDLFVWTAHSRTAYEILPAGTDNAMSYAISEVYPAPPPPPPGPTPAEAERSRDAVFDPFLLTTRLIATPHLRMDKPGVHVKLLQVAEDSHSYYVRMMVVNHTGQLYRVQNPHVQHIEPTFGAKMALRSINTQLTERNFARVLSYDCSPLRTHGSTLVPEDLRPGQSVEFVLAVEKPAHEPAMYSFDFPSDDSDSSIRAVAVF